MNEPSGREAEHAPIGALSFVYALFTVSVLAASLFVGSRYEPLLVRSLMNPAFAWQAGGGVAAVLLAQLVWGVLVLRRQLRRQRRSTGRLRFIILASGGIAFSLAVMCGGGFVLARMRPQDLLAGFGVSLGAREALIVKLSGMIGAAGINSALISAIATWTLLDAELRRRIWLVVDVALVFATAYAVMFLPAQPVSSSLEHLVQPIVRHTITTAFALRLIVRLLPPTMDLIESFGFQTLVAARHLRAKKSGFLAVISLLSILAVTVSSCALTTTLSVMGGFRNDLKRKILGNNAHIAIDRDHASIEAWAPLVKATGDTAGVIGASPYVSGEVMVSSASNLATAELRGIDTESVGKVNDLTKNLKTGSLMYLEHPEKLLDLPSDSTSSLFKVPDSIIRDAKTGEVVSTKQKHDAGKDESGDANAAELRKKLDDLDEFLRKDSAQHAGEKSRDVLPGIIIGQELARALRLYLGDELNVVAPLGALGPSGPMPKARPFRVAGIFYSGMYEYDMKFTYVSLATAQRFLNVGSAISGIEVKVKNVDTAPATANTIRQKLKRPELRVRDWQELNSRLFGALELEKLAMFIALGIAILVASFCIAGTLTLMVQEKGREVAILKAMGTSDATVVGVFIIEGGLIGLLGSALGLFLGYMMCFAAEHFGIRMNPEVYYIDRLPVHMDPTEFAFTGLAAIAVCLFVTVYPALLASRLRPVDALRYE